MIKYMTGQLYTLIKQVEVRDEENKSDDNVWLKTGPVVYVKYEKDGPLKLFDTWDEAYSFLMHEITDKVNIAEKELAYAKIDMLRLELFKATLDPIDPVK